MLSIRHGHKPEFLRVCSPSNTDRAHFISLKWFDPHAEQPRYIQFLAATGTYWTENHPANGPAIVDQHNVFDKILTAIDWQYRVVTYVGPNRDAVLAWDRASHGTIPAVVLTEDDHVLTYYHAPAEIREQVVSRPAPDSRNNEWQFLS